MSFITIKINSSDIHRARLKVKYFLAVEANVSSKHRGIWVLISVCWHPYKFLKFIELHR